MSEKKLKVQYDSKDFYTYKNPEGLIETINILTGEIVDKHKFNPIKTYQYSHDFADIVCQLIREGMTLTAICRTKGFPSYNTVCRWKKQNQEFNELLKEAKKDRAEVFMDKLITIADEAWKGNVDKESVAAMRLASEGFEKAAAAGNPAEFGKAKDQQVRVENLIIIQTGIDAPFIGSQPIEVKKVEG